MPKKTKKKVKVMNQTEDVLNVLIKSLMTIRVKLSKTERLVLKNTTLKYNMLIFLFYKPKTKKEICDFYYTKSLDIPKSLIKDAVEELAQDGDLDMSRKKCKNGHTVAQYMTNRTRIYVRSEIEDTKTHNEGYKKFKRKYESVLTRPYGFVVECETQRSLLNRIKYLIFGD